MVRSLGFQVRGHTVRLRALPVCEFSRWDYGLAFNLRALTAHLDEIEWV
jgi:hypothetical protein